MIYAQQIQTPRNKTTKKTARQAIIADLLDQARQEVIRIDIELQYLKDLKEKAKTDTSLNQAICTFYTPEYPLERDIEQREAHFKMALTKLNFLKDMRKDEQDKDAVKMAEKIRSTIPNEIKVDIVREK